MIGDEKLSRVAGLLLGVLLSAGANAQDIPDSPAAIAAAQAYLAPARFEPWAAVSGDIDGDGIPDAAVILTSETNGGDRDERLVVLLGTPSGAYKVLAASAAYCGTRYHYNLEIKAASVFVQGVTGIAPSAMTSTTLQFRFNPKLRDLELVKLENVEENTDEGSVYRERTDLARRVAVHSRTKGDKSVEARARLPRTPLPRLAGFDCGKYEPPRTSLHVEEDFPVTK